MESPSMVLLLLYPLVLRCNRFNLSRDLECSPSFRFTAPPLPTRCRSAGSQLP